MPRSLDQWLDYQQHLHARGIELGLDRVRAVWQRMGAVRPAPLVITVGGTNGKGSTVAFLEAMLRAGGMRVGAYTSPHILSYNERVRVDGVDAADDALCEAFARIESARGDTPLTYFEFGTLAAFEVFARNGVDVALLEVGLGGRLDAVNIIDADCSIVVTVDLDHMDYLGPDRESIGREKAGIFRAGRPAIVGESNPPQSLLDHAQAIGALVEVSGRDFQAEFDGDVALRGAFQRRNAATAIAALNALGARVRWNAQALARSDAAAPLLAGRLQRLGQHPDLIVDVGHNPQAARELAQWLDQHPVTGTTGAVFGALADKDVEGVVAALGARIEHWYLAGLESESPRGEPVAHLAARVRASLPGAVLTQHDDIAAALAAARAAAGVDDRILAFGSFHVVGPVLRESRRV